MTTESVKLPQTQHPVADFITQRWSARAFADRAIEPETLMTIFEAASWAPSANNEQPWRYIYAHRHDTEAFQKLWNCLLPGNQPWCKDAAVLVLALARKTFKQDGKPNRYCLHDTGMANANLLLQATHLGIYGHPMAGYDMAKTREAFQLPEDLDTVIFMALGYLGLPEQLDEPFRTREVTPRSRKPLDEIVFEHQLPSAS